MIYSCGFFFFSTFGPTDSTLPEIKSSKLVSVPKSIRSCPNILPLLPLLSLLLLLLLAYRVFEEKAADDARTINPPGFPEARRTIYSPGTSHRVVEKRKSRPTEKFTKPRAPGFFFFFWSSFFRPFTFTPDCCFSVIVMYNTVYIISLIFRTRKFVVVGGV